MTEQEMIEEMANILLETSRQTSADKSKNKAYTAFDVDTVFKYGCDRLNGAKALYEEGYRKIPDGAVVLTMEEYEELQTGKDFDYGYREGENNMTSYYENIRLPEVRKETAEKILSKVNEFFRPFDKKSPIFLDLLLTKLEMVVKKYGVEV